jgi:septum formation protein
VPHQVLPAGIDETPHKDEQPRPYARRMALEKAVLAAASAPGHFILAADTVVSVGRRILPKPEDEASLRACLTLLSGRRHHVMTGVVVVTPDGQRSLRVVDTAVIFARLDPGQIDAYAACGEGIGKAGGYAIQGRAAGFIRLLTGSYSGVVGLPLFETAQMLRGRGFPVP